MRTLFLVLALLSPAYAQGYLNGQVYQTTPQGVYLQNQQGISFIPSALATFRVGGARVSLSALGVGSPVQAYYQPSYVPQCVPTEYYQEHRDWDWNRQRQSWANERQDWHQDHGRWSRNHHDNGHHNGWKKHRGHGHGHDRD